MDTIWFYVFAVSAFVIGGVLWLKTDAITWKEWIAGSVASFALAGAFHALAINGATADVETWSGHIIRATHYPQWVEEYQQMHTREVPSGTDSKGNTTYTTEIYYTTEHRTHPEEWIAYSNIHSEIAIGSAFFAQIQQVFGNLKTETPHKSGFYSGDRNVYTSYNVNSGEYFPVTDIHSWTNKIRATPTTFSFPKVPKDVKVFPYPKNGDHFHSDRLIGSASLLNLTAFDRMNARLGPRKKVNVILIGFGGRDSLAAKWQEAAWIGGKKNDVVICFGGVNSKPTWATVFGWTDSKTALRNLESIVLENGVSDATLPLIEQEIISGYKLKDWDRSFSYIRVPAPLWAIICYLAVAVAGQAGYWYWAILNDITKIRMKERWT